MKVLLIFVSFMTLGIIMYSCKHDKAAEPATPVVYPNFSKFKAGSYWVYQRFTVDSSGNATATNVYDSCYVEKDTIINNKSYVKMYHPNPYNPYYNYLIIRDSLHYIVSVSGEILFSSQDFQTVFKTWYVVTPVDTVCRITAKMTDKDLPVSVPAGTFTTSDYQQTFSMYPMYLFAGNPRYQNTRYAENTGIIIETLPFFVSIPTYTERRLLRYHINL
jgi:hypothetical protein